MIKRATTEEFITDLIWDKSAGPLENILTWVNRYFITFGGGWSFVVGGALTAVGWDMSALGRVLDRKLGLTDIDQVMSADPVEVARTASSIVDMTSRSSYEYELMKSAGPIDNIMNSVLRTEQKDRMYGRGRKSKTIGVFTKFFPWLWSILSDEGSWLGRALRLSGVLAAEHISHPDHQHAGERRKDTNTVAPKSTKPKSYKQQLEDTVDSILA